MIIYGILSILIELITFLFGWLNLPDMPEVLTQYIDVMMGYIVDGLPLLWLFFDKSVVTVCLVIALACVNFDKVYGFTMWIIAKLPLGIHKN